MTRRRSNLLPYALLAPGLLWLAIFFAVPLYYMAEISLKTGTLETGYQLTWHFETYTDSMQIPVGAPHAFTAEKLIDWYYDPEIQAVLTAYLNYVPPAKGTKEVLVAKDPEIAENDLIFPDLTNAHDFKTFPPEQEREIDEAFQRAIGA